ncbi:MAG: sigma-70 family RNA polymerase sigma factor [Candidatus Omnitrophica bacterium]|nr:sigma-70 family RNA polymerase sigma factor [Candidatus Omnitrophota bacterium]
MNDQNLIAACIGGERGAWELFVERFSKLIYWSIRKTLEGTAFNADLDLHGDIFQELFMRLMDKNELAQLREASSLKRFLVVSASYAARDRLKSLTRAEKNRIPLEALERVEGRAALPPGMAEALDRALSDLDPRARACVELYYLDRKTFQEIGEVMGIPQNTVSTIVRRAKEKLRARLVSEGFDREAGNG